MLQTIERFIESLVLFGEVQANQVIDVLAEKARSRYGTYADISCQYLAELKVAFVPEFRDIKQDVIRALRYGVDNADIIKSVQKQIALFGVFILKPLVILVTEIQSDNCSLLQWCCRAYCQKIVHLFRHVDDIIRRDDIT